MLQKIACVSPENMAKYWSCITFWRKFEPRPHFSKSLSIVMLLLNAEKSKHQGLHQDLKTACLKLPFVNILVILFFMGEDNKLTRTMVTIIESRLSGGGCMMPQMREW